MAEQSLNMNTNDCSSENVNNVFRFMTGSPRQPSATVSPFNGIQFTSQDLGKMFTVQGQVTSDSPAPASQEPLPEQQFQFRKIARPILPSLITEFAQTSMIQNNYYMTSPADIPDFTSPYRRRDSNVSAMSIQGDTPTRHRRDSNVSAISMQLDTPTPSENESCNDDDPNKPAFSFQFMPKSFSRPDTPTSAPSTPPMYPTNLFTTPTVRPTLFLSNTPQLLRRSSMSDLNLDSSPSGSFSDSRSERPSPVYRPVRARRASLLPKIKSFTRVVNELQEEASPIEAEIRQEYKTTKVLKGEHVKLIDCNQRQSEDFIVDWLKFRDVQPSPPPSTVSKSNPEVEMIRRQDITSPVQPNVGSIAGRVKRKTSEDRFGPYFNPKRRAASPSLVGSFSGISTISPSPSPSSSGVPSYGSNFSTASQNGVAIKEPLYRNSHEDNDTRNSHEGNESYENGGRNGDAVSIHDTNRRFSTMSLN
ncbi:6267_t:CDS:2 [Paraglomus occultum]|uniref:6267_t:CDS:1 n=1 Tax=Paraglomus occultum TaxID=144539 RepID=A0A9N8ZCF7_9GLOM|nr:6267_t:CDS:2 [Paraglomus occultum]